MCVAIALNQNQTARPATHTLLRIARGVQHDSKRGNKGDCRCLPEKSFQTKDCLPCCVPPHRPSTHTKPTFKAQDCTYTHATQRSAYLAALSGCAFTSQQTTLKHTCTPAGHTTRQPNPSQPDSVKTTDPNLHNNSTNFCPVLHPAATAPASSAPCALPHPAGGHTSLHATQPLSRCMPRHPSTCTSTHGRPTRCRDTPSAHKDPHACKPS